MTSLVLQPGALTGVLWPKHPTIRSTGLVVEASFNDPVPNPPRLFTSAAFNPSNENVFCFADSSGAVYSASIERNRYTLVARLPNPVSSIAYVNDHTSIAAAAGLVTFVVNTDSAKVTQKLRGPHSNKVLKVVSPPLLRGVAATLSSDTLVFWNTNAGTVLSNERQPAAFVDATTHSEEVYTLSAEGSVKLWSFVDRKCTTSTRVGLEHPVRIACSAHFVVCGAENATVVILRATSLHPMWTARVHGQAPSVYLAHCGTNVFACMQLDGLVSFIAVGNARTRDEGNNADGDTGGESVGSDPGVVVGQSLELGIPANHTPVLTVGAKSHYAVVVSTNSLQLFHLPTAKIAHDQIVAAKHATAAVTGQRLVLPFVGIGTDSPSEREESGRPRVPLPKPVMPPPTTEGIQRYWMKVNLTQTTGRPSKSSPVALFASDAVRERYNERLEAAKKIDPNPRSGSPPPGGEATAIPVSREVPPAKQSMAAPASVQKFQSGRGASGLSSYRTPKRPPSGSKDASAAASQFDSISSVTVDSLINIRSLSDVASRSVNLEKLRGILMRYGAYPDRFRTFVWRFLLDLGSKEESAPLFAVLAARGTHPGTASLLQPFPLPDNRLRNALEKTLSCLAHHAPVFAVAHFIPSIVFPFVSVFHSDVQSSIETVLAFTVNWGQEFFQYYPHMPVALASLITHLLKAEDPELLAYFQAISVGPEIYVWDLVAAVYTEVLTRQEWLQLMDHAFSNEPLWLWLWHVRWLCQMKSAFMSFKEAPIVASLFRRATPFDMNATIQQTYRLHGRCPRNELTAPYEKFRVAPHGEYPRPIEVHESVVVSRLEELKQIEQHEAQVLRMHERARKIERELMDAAMTEDAYVARQRALVSAKMDGERAVWSQRVALEQERNRLRQIEHEARLKAVQAQLAATERIEQVRADLGAASVAEQQAAMDRQQETMKWRFADRMSDLEIERLERAALARLQSTTRSSEGGTLQGGGEAEVARKSSSVQTVADSRQPPPVVRIGSDSWNPDNAALASSVPPQPHRSGPPSPTPRRVDEAPQTPNEAPSPQPNGRPSAVLERSQESGDEGPPPVRRPTNYTQDAATSQTPPSRGLPPVAATPSSTGRTSQSHTATTEQSGSVGVLTGTTTATSSSQKATTTSTANVTTDCDAHEHLQQLHIEIRQRVEQAQREQRAALAALRSRYAHATSSALAPSAAMLVSQGTDVSDNTTSSVSSDGDSVGGDATNDEPSSQLTSDRSSMIGTLSRPQNTEAYRFARQ